VGGRARPLLRRLRAEALISAAPDGKLTYLDDVEMVDFEKHFPKLDKDVAGGADVQSALLDGARALPTPDA
jgi:hypothetical protein